MPGINKLQALNLEKNFLKVRELEQLFLELSVRVSNLENAFKELKKGLHYSEKKKAKSKEKNVRRVKKAFLAN